MKPHDSVAALTSRSYRHTNDGERYRGDNFLLLLNLASDSRVLILGEKLRPWREAFRSASFGDFRSKSDLAAGTFDLVLYHTGSAGSEIEFVEHLRCLKTVISEKGALLVFAENFFSHLNLKSICRGKTAAVTGKLRSGYAGYRKTLNVIGFPMLQGFIPMPGLEVPEELWAFDSPSMELPHYWHPLLRLVHKRGWFRHIAEGYLFLATPASVENSRLLRAVRDVLPGGSGGAGGTCLLERADLRLRGAMVLFVLDAASRKRVVARVVSDPSISAIVEKNQAFLRFLQSSGGISSEMKGLLPCPIDQLSHDDSDIYIETMLPGIPAWKANRSRLRKRIYEESVQFIVALGRATRWVSSFPGKEIDRLLEEDFYRLGSSVVIEAGFLAEITKLGEKLRVSLEQPKLFLVASHGDYGYGNILVDGKSGKVTGIIDWDTGKEKDFPGIDLFNLYVQKARAEMNCGVYHAFKDVIARYLSGELGKSFDSYLGEFGITGDLCKRIPYLCLIRYMARSSQYPSIFQKEQREYQDTYQLMQDQMPI